jgi:hypothetical protein
MMQREAVITHLVARWAVTSHSPVAHRMLRACAANGIIRSDDVPPSLWNGRGPRRTRPV